MPAVGDEPGGTNPRIRRPTAEMATIPLRLEHVEEHVKEQRRLNEGLTEGLWALRMTLEKGLNDLSSRMKTHDESRDLWRKVLISVLGGVALLLLGWLANISRIVQGAKIQPP